MNPPLSPLQQPLEDSAPGLGTSLGAYQLLQVLGEGTMGRVYLGRHQRLGRRVALKVLHARNTSDVSLLRRFLQEARAVNQIDHEHIVQIYDLVEEPGRVYCVMELLEGHTLADRLREGGVGIDTVVKIGAEIASALAAAHAVGVVHRDLKPDNIFLVRHPRDPDCVKVVDFGVAKLADGPVTAVSETAQGAVIGTPLYMSPEQAAGLEVDHRADIYSFGTVLYEMLAGKTPFQANSFGLLAAELITQPPPPLPDYTPGGESIPAALSELVLACLAKQPSARPASMAGLRTRLQQCTDTEQVMATSPGLAQKAPVARRWFLPLALGLVVSMLAAATWFALESDGEARPAPAPATLAASPGVTAAPPAASPAAAPRTVRFELRSTPSGASVFRTDTHELLGVTPLEASLPRGDSALALRFELAGHVALTREVMPDRDQRLEVSLPRAPEPAREAKPAKKARPVREGVLDPFGD